MELLYVKRFIGFGVLDDFTKPIDHNIGYRLLSNRVTRDLTKIINKTTLNQDNNTPF